MKKFDIACVIDDDEIYTFTVKRIINNSEIAHKTLFFPNGKLALDFFTEYVTQTDSLPDLILLDINMPGVDGTEVLAYLRREPRLIPVPVFMITSDDQPETRKKVMKLGATAMLLKPATIDVLEQALKKAKLL